MSSKKKSVTKSEQATETKNAGVIAKASTVKVDGVLDDIAKSTVKVTQLFADAGAQVTSQLGELQRIGEAIVLRNKELEDTFGKEVVQLELEAMKTERDTKKEEYRLEIEAARAERDRELEDLRIERDREEKNHIYERDQRRKENQDAFQEQCRVRNLKETERAEQLAKSWAEREAALAARETEYKTAIDKLATFDEMVKKAADKEIAIVTNVMKREHEHQNKLRDVEHNAKIQVLEKDLETQSALAADLKEQATTLKIELRDTQVSLANLASKAVDGAAVAKAQADAVSLFKDINNNGARSKSS